MKALIANFQQFFSQKPGISKELKEKRNHISISIYDSMSKGVA